MFDKITLDDCDLFSVFHQARIFHFCLSFGVTLNRKKSIDEMFHQVLKIHSINACVSVYWIIRLLFYCHSHNLRSHTKSSEMIQNKRWNTATTISSAQQWRNVCATPIRCHAINLRDKKNANTSLGVFFFIDGRMKVMYLCRKLRTISLWRKLIGNNHMIHLV